VLDEIQDRALLTKVTKDGAWLGGELRALQSRLGATIVDVRGSGFIWGIELDQKAAPVQKELLAKGFVVGTARDNVLRLLPPYVTPKKAFIEFISALEATLGAAREKAA
jgi:acetylornithine/succinyldiaminopimelate/putrescine aminotransferase